MNDRGIVGDIIRGLMISLFGVMRQLNRVGSYNDNGKDSGFYSE